MKNIITAISISLLIVSCGNEEVKTETPIETVVTTNEEFSTLLKSYYDTGLEMHPMNATYAGDTRFNDILPNILSDEYIAKEKKVYSDYLKQLDSFNNENLNEEEQFTKEILLWDCNINLDRLNFREDLLPINQFWTQHLTIGQFASGSGAQPFETVEDYNNWLKRVDAYLEWVVYAEERMNEGIEVGYVLPKSLIVKVIPQFGDLAKGSTEEHLFYQPVNNFPEGISQEDQDRLTTAYKNMVENKIIPAYAKMHAYLSTTYLEAGKDESGISTIPQGEEYYAHQIKLNTTTTMTADEIFELGMSEVERISTEMEKVKTKVGYEGDLISFFDYVRENPELMPYKNAQQVIDNFNQIHETMKPQLAQLFDLTPKTPFEVRRTEAFREASASAEYNQGSLDGTRPGVFYTPIPDASKYNVFSDEALFLHEAIPGHHYQISLTQESTTLPEFRKTLWYSAYGEGWALYTESLGRELGLYTDPYQYFGMLSMEMHRAIRLVVDPGMHVKGWTREQAIQFSLDHEAEPKASIISEIERYMANPGQALSYKIGQLKIQELRARAEKELGEKFDIKQFHNEILVTGCIPLALLESKIDKWIEASK